MSFKEEVIELLCKTAKSLFDVDDSMLNENTRFVEDLHCKSIDMIKFTSELEDEYDAEVPYMAFNRNKTFAEAAEFMSKLTGYE